MAMSLFFFLPWLLSCCPQSNNAQHSCKNRIVKAGEELLLPRVCKNKRNQRRSEKKAEQKSVKVKRRNQGARKQASISRGGNVRRCKVLKKDRDGGEESLSVLSRVWTLCELLVTVRRAPRLLGGSVSVELRRCVGEEKREG